MTASLFPEEAEKPRLLTEGAWLLPGYALTMAADLLGDVSQVTALAPFRQMETKGGYRMSVAMTNCGELGWISDRRGYRYGAIDPLSGNAWPAMPAAFQRLAIDAATRAGFSDFMPDVCLINRYEPGTRLSLHQDRDERDYGAPIVSVSLGAPAIFLFGGATRNAPQQRIKLRHGDVVVWGGPARLNYHGVTPLKPDDSTTLGAQRINLTFRKAS